MSEKDYIAVVQCHIVKQRCSGYFCEQAFHNREGEFTRYPADKPFRTIYMTCGGCCGKAVHRKLGHLVRRLKREVSKRTVSLSISRPVSQRTTITAPCVRISIIFTYS